MKKKLITILFLATTLVGYSQKGPKAKSILDKVSSKTKSYKTIKSNFSYNMENLQDGVNETFEGTVFVKGNKYKILLMGTETYSNGKNRWVYMPDEEEVNLYEVEKKDRKNKNQDDDVLSNPRDLFNIYNKGFKYKYISEVVEDGRKLYLIELVPRNKKKNFFKIKVKIDKAKYQLYSIKYFSKDGNRYTIKIKNFKPNVKMQDDMFTFDTKAHPDVEVVDMRE
ncbi:MAG: outer membrane lipoprotein carrier protein LolA [Bacteroidetes bacterium]|nr:MAG: outer membrane lipoprotein carrier protein LolA [Bacteroidota bacterium]